MDLLVQTLLITLVAAFGFAHDGVGSTMWNRPIVMAPLVGLVLGDIRTGIMTGATLELIWLGAFPVGASCPPEMVSGAIIGTSFVINSGGEPSAAVALAVPVATLVLMIKTGLRVLITSLYSVVMQINVLLQEMLAVLKEQRRLDGFLKLFPYLQL